MHSRPSRALRLGSPKGHLGAQARRGERRVGPLGAAPEGIRLWPPQWRLAPPPGNWARSPRPAAETPATGGASTSEPSAAWSLPGLRRPPGPFALAPAGARWAAAGTRGYGETRGLRGGQGLSSGELDTLPAQSSAAPTFFWKAARECGVSRAAGQAPVPVGTPSRSLFLAASLRHPRPRACHPGSAAAFVAGGGGRWGAGRGRLRRGGASRPLPEHEGMASGPEHRVDGMYRAREVSGQRMGRAGLGKVESGSGVRWGPRQMSLRHTRVFRSSFPFLWERFRTALFLNKTQRVALTADREKRQQGEVCPGQVGWRWAVC